MCVCVEGGKREEKEWDSVYLTRFLVTAESSACQWQIAPDDRAFHAAEARRERGIASKEEEEEEGRGTDGKRDVAGGY